MAEAKIHPETFTPTSFAKIEADEFDYENSRGLFWEITAPNGAVSHLWGTMHSNHPLILDLPDAVEAQITAARVILPEFDFIVKSRRALELRNAYHLRLREGRRNFIFDTDSTGLSPDVIDWIASRLHGLGWGRSAANALTLGGLAEVILSDPCDDFAAGVFPIQDGRIQMLGLIAGATVKGLEHPNDLVRHLDQPENEDLALAMLAVYGSYLAPRKDARGRASIFAMYLQGRCGLMRATDAAYLKEVLKPDGAKKLALVDDYLLVERNHIFLKAARPELDEGSAFIAVGCAHLSGAQGMVSLLRNAGYTVTRIPLPGEYPDP